MKRLAIITTHPIQYNAPLFKLLNQRENITIKVFYTWGQGVLENKFDPGFGKTISWDIPLLDGYDYQFEKNIAANAGSHHFKGIDNPELISDIKNWKADAILVYGWSFKSHLQCLRYFYKKTPVYFRGDSTLLNEKPGFRKFLRRLFLHWVYRHVDMAFYVGTHNRAYFYKHGLKENQLAHLPHVVDNSRFKEPDAVYQKAALQLKEQLGIPEEDIVFLYAGKMEPVKNLPFLLKAFVSVQNKSTHLIIAGNGLLEQELTATYGINKLIHFIPFQNQATMPVLYRACDVFILPSLSETWGLSINEAMACSRAILASDKCGAAIDLVKEGLNGFIFRSGDMQDLEAKMNLLAGNKTMLQQMGRASGQVIEKWNLETVADMIEKTIHEYKPVNRHA